MSQVVIENSVINSPFYEPTRHFLADGPLAVLHFGNMALRDAGHVGQLFLGKTFSMPRSAQADPRKVLIGLFGVSLAPGDRS